MPGVSKALVRSLPIGAELRDGGVHVRVWAPRARLVEVVFESGGDAPLEAEADGYHSGFVAGIGPGATYRFRLDGRGPYPDPASRFQPEGPHGPSRVVDPSAFTWSDRGWKGVAAEGQVIYELHIGTFTPEGRWEAAIRDLPRLRDLGITVVEVMPVADFPGRFGWGYDGVNLFAPTRLYGSPDDFRRFVDRAHALGLGVILDVVYNHFGPDGNYLSQFSESYFTDRYACEWGTAINFDGPDAGPVREFFISNAEHWIVEYHLDGLRFDATQAMQDRSDEHLLAALQRRVRKAAGTRALYLIAENDDQQAELLRPPAEGGTGLNALWNDDFHHSARVALTGKREGYFADFQGKPQELVSAVKWGFLFQGQRHSVRRKPRGSASLDLPGPAFVNFLENHDQVANSGHGRRLSSLSPAGLHRALSALLLLAPGTPLLFQGQEYSSSKPFLYFADHAAPLGALVAEGRKKFLAQFPSLAGPEMQARLPDPTDPESFRASVLDPAERERHPEALRLHRDLLALRRDDPVFRSQRSDRLFGAVLSPDAFALRFLDPDAGDRLLLINLGVELSLAHLPEPLLAPPRGGSWTLRWTSEDPIYGGSGGRMPFQEEGLVLQARSAALLHPTTK